MEWSNECCISSPFSTTPSAPVRVVVWKMDPGVPWLWKRCLHSCHKQHPEILYWNYDSWLWVGGAHLTVASPLLYRFRMTGGRHSAAGSRRFSPRSPSRKFPPGTSPPSDMDWSLCDEISCLGMSWQQFEQDDSMALDPLPWNLWHLIKSPVLKHWQHTSLLQLVHDVHECCGLQTVYPSCWIANLHRPWIIAQCPPCRKSFPATKREGKARRLNTIVGPMHLITMLLYNVFRYDIIWVSLFVIHIILQMKFDRHVSSILESKMLHII